MKRTIITNNIYLSYKEIPSWVHYIDKQINLTNSTDDIDISSIRKARAEFSDIDIALNRNLSISRLINASGELSIIFDDRSVWKMPKEYKVQDFLYYDIDNDGKEEIVMLCWKKGHFGKYTPFWITEDKELYSQHIFIYRYENGQVIPMWKASYVSEDTSAISEYEVDGYKLLKLTNTYGKRTIWAWDSFGIKYLCTPKFDMDKATDKVNNSLSINVYGDNLIHEAIYKNGVELGNYDFLYKDIKRENKKVDYSIINNETMLVDDESKYDFYPLFGTPLGVGEAIKNAGFDMVTLANNHVLDKGIDGINTTLNFYKKNNIECVGIGKKSIDRYKILNKGNLNIAILNYTYGVNKVPKYNDNIELVNILDDEKKVLNNIEEAKRKTDVCIVIVHWGDEYKEEISEFQKKWSQLFLKAGVDIVVGMHPHILQKVEVLKDIYGNEMLVYYSLGNVVSAQSNPKCRVGGEAILNICNTNNGIKINHNLKIIETRVIDGVVSAFVRN